MMASSSSSDNVNPWISSVGDFADELTDEGDQAEWDSMLGKWQSEMRQIFHKEPGSTYLTNAEGHAALKLEISNLQETLSRAKVRSSSAFLTMSQYTH
jgi:hypothetical protein